MTIQAITTAITRVDNDMYIKSLFDPVQTHAVYGVPDYLIHDVKAALKREGATRFRVCNAGVPGFKIVCFKVK